MLSNNSKQSVLRMMREMNSRRLKDHVHPYKHRLIVLKKLNAMSFVREITARAASSACFKSLRKIRHFHHGFKKFFSRLHNITRSLLNKKLLFVNLKVSGPTIMGRLRLTSQPSPLYPKENRPSRVI